VRLTQPWIIVRGTDDAPPVGMLLLPRHLIKGEAGLQIGVFCDFFLYYAHFIEIVPASYKLSELLLIKVAFGTFFYQVRVHYFAFD